MHPEGALSAAPATTRAAPPPPSCGKLHIRASARPLCPCFVLLVLQPLANLQSPRAAEVLQVQCMEHHRNIFAVPEVAVAPPRLLWTHTPFGPGKCQPKTHRSVLAAAAIARASGNRADSSQQRRPATNLGLRVPVLGLGAEQIQWKFNGFPWSPKAVYFHQLSHRKTKSKTRS